MANPNYTKQPVNRVPDNLLRLILTAMDRAIQRLSETTFSTGGGGSGSSGSATTTAPRASVRWVANGPYQVGTEVDGAWVCPATMTIFSVRIHRETDGASGQTVVDLNKNGTTMYTTQANRATLAVGTTAAVAALPDVRTVVTGDVLTIDIDEKDAGKPEGLTLIVEGM